MAGKSLRKNKSVTIAHISDFHVGSQYFVSNLLSQTVREVNKLSPDVVVITGDLTEEGLRQEYRAVRSYLKILSCPNVLMVPGNHDARHVGYIHFEEFFGSRNSVLRINGLTAVGADSSEPDLDEGRIGRERYRGLEDDFDQENGYRVLALHHHLLPVPGTGRERNIVYDAGDVLGVLVRSGVDLVLCGHKHVPHIWRLENLVVVNAGTSSSMKLRGRTKPCYNIINVKEEHLRIYRKYPFGDKKLIADFSLTEKEYCKWELEKMGGKPSSKKS